MAKAHNALGVTHGIAVDLDQALHHYRQAIGYYEQAGQVYDAGQTRFNVALALDRAGCFPDALEYARAARRNFATFGDRALEDIQKTDELIAALEQALKAQAGDRGKS
jgi:tetratricopeptide (TPR) repeat protein